MGAKVPTVPLKSNYDYHDAFAPKPEQQHGAVNRCRNIGKNRADYVLTTHRN
jgi:hypothetical protein